MCDAAKMTLMDAHQRQTPDARARCAAYAVGVAALAFSFILAPFEGGMLTVLRECLLSPGSSPAPRRRRQRLLSEAAAAARQAEATARWGDKQRCRDYLEREQ